MVTQINTRNGSNFSHTAQMRLNEIKSKIKNLESKMGVQKSVNLSIGKFGEMACAKLGENTIQLPPWFLFNYEDIPERFRVSNVDDHRLRDPDFLNDLAGWMNEKFQQAGISSVVRRADFGILQATISLVRDRNLYEKSKDFTIAHELAHLNHTQVDESNFYLHRVQETISAGGLISGIFLLVLAVSILPYVPIAVTLVVAGVGVSVSIATLISWLNRSLPSVQKSHVEEEKLADLDAVEALQDAQGGIYYFDSLRIHNLAVRSSNSSAISQVDLQGNNLKDKGHPLLTERIAYLRQWQATHQRA